MKSIIFAPLALALAAATLTACNEKPAQTADEVNAKPGVAVTNGRLVLPAVSGNPAALYFDIVNNGDDYAVLRKAEVPGAKETAMHQSVTANGVTQMQPLAPVNLEKGKPVKFEPSGYHVMVMGLAPAPKAGETTEVTLTFAGGDKLSFDAKVEGPGGGN
ncbi:MAG: copper chaperone PCu(A)C [Rhodocyclaceae bacterium]|nr:MAG: copper chaperone PCu(A)C [Rhodocyclaceae bacterium]